MAEDLTARNRARVQALYQAFAPGTLSWLDPSNNRAFSAQEIFLTANGVSLYFSITNSKDEKTAAAGKMTPLEVK